MRKTKRVIAALTAAIITATSTSLMSVCADENGGSDFGFVSKSTTNKSDNIEAVESNAQLYEKLAQLLKQGDMLKYGEALYTTGTPDGEKWTKEFYEQRVEFYGEDLLSKYIVDGEFLRKSVESDMKGLLNKTENELDKYVDIINEYLISNSIAGSAYAIKNDGVDKLLITYDGQLEKIQAYIAEIGIDEDLVVYEQGHDMIETHPATTIAVTETKPVTTITMPVLDDPTIQTAVVKVTVMDVSGDNILVKPVDGSPELNSSDKFYLSSKKLTNDIKPKVGMKLEITYNGNILETYPAQFGNVKKVVEIKEDTVKEDLTLLKGTKDMTLNDVMRLAELGNELDWADFDNYNGKIMPVNAWVNGWHFDLGNDFSLEVLGNPPDKPEIVRLYLYDFDNGIDIRTNDVKEYIASTATPVSENSENSTLKATAESVSKFMSENGISGYAYVGKADGVEKIYIPYAGDLEKLKTYVAEKGIDESLVVYQLSDWNNYGSGQSSGNKEVQKPLISEDDILDLSKKGDELTWSDFEKYEFTDIGDGTNIWQFVIKNSGSKLLVIGRNLKEKPEHINFVWGNGAEFDIRTEDLTPWFYDDALVVKGDANCDGQVDLSDAVMIMQALANPNKYGIDGTAEHHLTEQGRLNADVDGDGLTVGDAQSIQLKLLGIVESKTNSDLKDIVSIRTPYDPIMSNWSGIGILLEFDSPDYQITLFAEDGQFTYWDINKGSGPIKDVGTTYEVGKNGYIFWTPDDLKYPEDFATEIIVKGTSSNKSVELGRIYVTRGERSTLIASLEKPDTAIDPMQPEIQPLGVGGIDEAITLISNYDLNNYDKVYHDSYKKMFERFKNDGFINQVTENETIKENNNRGVALFPYAKYEDIGVGYYVTFKEKNYHIIFYYADAEVITETEGIVEYLKKRMGRSSDKIIKIQDKDVSLLFHENGQCYANAFIDENHYFDVIGAVSEDELIEFLNAFEYGKLNLKSDKRLKLIDDTIKSINVTSLPKGYDFTFTDSKAQKFIDFLSDMELTDDFSEDPGQLNGMTWVIKLEYQNNETMTLYDIGGYIRSENDSWLKYEYDYDSPLNTLIWELSK